MAVKTVEIAGIGTVALHKRRGVHGVRISISHDNTVRVSLPTWAPYQLGIEFAKNKAEWISSQRKPRQFISNGDRVGKAHRFAIVQSVQCKKPIVRLVGTEIRLLAPLSIDIQDDVVQHAAEKGAIRALKKEATQLLPQRLSSLATKYDFTYKSVNIKQLKSRWGSCTENRDITLNCFLMQLPWHLIDYVLLHELTHTRIMQHGSPFWNELGTYIPNLKTTRKEMKTHKPTLLVETLSATNEPGNSIQLDIK